MKKLFFIIAMLVCLSAYSQVPYRSDVLIKGHLTVDDYVESPEGRFDKLITGDGKYFESGTTTKGDDVFTFSGAGIQLTDPTAKYWAHKTDLSRGECDPHSYGAQIEGLTDVTAYFNSPCDGGDNGLVIHPTAGIYRFDGTVTFDTLILLKIDPGTLFTGFGTLIGNQTRIDADTYQWLDTTITIAGTWIVDWQPVWFGGNFVEQGSNTNAVDSIMTALTTTDDISVYSSFAFKKSKFINLWADTIHLSDDSRILAIPPGGELKLESNVVTLYQSASVNLSLSSTHTGIKGPLNTEAISCTSISTSSSATIGTTLDVSGFTNLGDAAVGGFFTAEDESLFYGFAEFADHVQMESVSMAKIALNSQAVPPSSPTKGTLYMNDDGHLYYYSGSAWVQL